jgi:STE24 endopeptidase
LTHAGLRWLGTRLDRTGSAGALRRAEAMSRAFSVYVVAQAALAFWMVGWLAAVREWTGDLVLVDEAVASAPFVVALLAGWWSWAPIERRLIEASMLRAIDRGEPVHPPPSALEVVLDRARHRLAIGAVVILVVLGWSEVVVVAAERLLEAGALESMEQASLLAAVAQGLVAIPVLIAGPVLVRALWRTTPLARGELHRRVTSICARHRVRFRDVLIWRTRGAMLNGAVLGVAGPLRYILLTDALIERLPAEQLDAVVAHEVAHVKRKHLPWLLASTAVWAIAGGVAASLVLSLLGAADDVGRAMAEAATLAAAAGAGILAFGYVSRRFEREADAFAAQSLTGTLGEAEAGEERGRVSAAAAAAMAGALTRVARLNHVPAERFGFRHGSIQSRVTALRRMVGERVGATAADRASARAKAATIAAGAVVAAVIVAVEMGL